MRVGIDAARHHEGAAGIDDLRTCRCFKALAYGDDPLRRAHVALLREQYRLMARASSVVVCVSELLAEHVRATYGLGHDRVLVVPNGGTPPAFLEFVAKQLTGFYPSKLARFLPDRWLAPAARLVKWAVRDPLVPADSPTAYEYLIVAEAE